MKKLPALLSILAVAALGLTGCSAPNPTTEKIEKIAESETNPNHLVTDSSVISLLETPEEKGLPLWKTKLETPEGWIADAAMAAEVEGETPKIPEYFERVRYTNAKQSCEIMAGTEYLESWNSGRGDLFLSKDYLYRSLDTYNTLPSNEKTVEFKVDDKTMQFVTANYDSIIQIPGYDPETFEPTKELKEVNASGYMAVRGIDITVDAIAPIENRFGTDKTKSVPVLRVSYTCQDSKDLDEKVWNTFLESIALSYKATK